jgi:Flp pilus assembly CpaF family ATPase
MLWIVAFAMAAAFVYLLMFKPQRKVKALYKYQTLREIQQMVATHFRDRTYINKRSSVSSMQAENEIANKQLMVNTIDEATRGSYAARQALIDEIAAYLVGEQMNVHELDDLSCIVYRDPESMSSNEKFETMYYFIKKGIRESLSLMELYDEDAMPERRVFEKFVEITQIFNATRIKKTTADKQKHEGYFINNEDLDSFFRMYMLDNNLSITVADAVQITATLIYQGLFGYGPVDSLVYDNSIDELELGMSGATRGSARHIISPLNSTTVHLSNRQLSLQCIHFANMEAYEKVISLLCSNGEATFTAADGFKYANLAKEPRRVTSRRPPAADLWAVNVRKLDAHVVTNRELLLRNPVPIFGTDFVEDTLQVAAWAKTAMCVTGGQGTGKTSHINGYVDLLEPDVPIRAVGNIDESDFRNRYPERNAQHFFSTPRQDLHAVAGMMRRTRGDFVILMEVLDAASGQEAINNLKSGYTGGMLTGHGGTSEAMITFMAQLLAMGQSTSSIETTKIVASTLRMNTKTAKYGRIFHYDFIEEIVLRDWNIDWSRLDHDMMGVTDTDRLLENIANNNRLYYENITNPDLYFVNRIVQFDKRTLTYKPANRFTPNFCAELFLAMGAKRRKFFLNYMQTYFGVDLAQELIDTGVIMVSSKAELMEWVDSD